MALSTGAAEAGQRLIVAALSWSWQSATVDPLTGEIGVGPRASGASPADFAALEHALRLAGRWRALVIAATVGPPAADALLRTALAAGAAGALRVEHTGRAGGTDPIRLVGGDPGPAAALAAALRHHFGMPDLVLCGDRTADRGTGSFPAFLAAELNAQQALGAVQIEPRDDGTLQVTRRLDGGRREVLRATGPVVVSVEAAGVRLRRASLPTVLAGQQAPIPVARPTRVMTAPRVRTLAAHPYRPRPQEVPRPSGGTINRLRELTGALTERTPPAIIGPLDPGQAADELLGYLRRHGYLEGQGG